MKKSTLIMILSLIMAVAVGMGSTVAYLQDTDEDVNVMTLGNVKIEQIELERIEQSNDDTESTNLQEFVQGKPLYPAVGEAAWAKDESGAKVYQKWPYAGSSALFDAEKLTNVVDKFVFVENTGKSDAYVRTIFAFEIGSMDVDAVAKDLMIHLNNNDINTSETGSGHWSWTWLDTPVEIDGGNYAIAEALYLHKSTVQGTAEEGILPAGATSYPSLLQVFLDPKATNEDVEAIDSNGNGTYDILVVSQAVQTMGFKDAQTALDAAFGKITAENHPWLGVAPNDAPTKYPFEKWEGEDENKPEADEAGVYNIGSAEELAAFAAMVNEGGQNFSGKTVKLTADIDLAGKLWTPIGQTGATTFAGVFDGDGHTISNMTINSSDKTGKNYSSGLFGWIESHGNMGITIKNVNFDNANVTGHHNVAVVVGYVYGIVENCHVTNSTVTNNHYDSEACGDKTGIIAGYAGPAADKVRFDNCSATDCTVISGRDAGQLIGCGYANSMSNMSATNVTVKATGDCPEEKRVNETIIGRQMD